MSHLSLSLLLIKLPCLPRDFAKISVILSRPIFFPTSSYHRQIYTHLISSTLTQMSFQHDMYLTDFLNIFYYVILGTFFPFMTHLIPNKGKGEKILLLYGPHIIGPDKKGSVSVGSKQRPFNAKWAHCHHWCGPSGRWWAILVKAQIIWSLARNSLNMFLGASKWVSYLFFCKKMFIILIKK